ncbi:MAG: hypothetical protein IH953_08360 [Chloroflexi bacterium]|nr:hypothetical protein [Chloroflexota bacterium]
MSEFRGASSGEKTVILVVAIGGLWLWGWIAVRSTQPSGYTDPVSLPSRSALETSGEVNWGSKEKGWYACRVEARKRLKSPSSAKFPPYNSSVEDLVVHYPPSGYTVTAWVDAKNTFGVELRNGYVCGVRFTGWESWVLLDYFWLE